MVAFVNTKYEDDRGRIHPMRLTPEYSTEAGTEPTGAVDSDIKVQVSKTKREFGIRPRGVTLSRTLGTGDAAFRKYAFLPLRSIADSNAAGYAIGSSITVGGFTWTVVSKVPEDY